jgi:large repetitive protein
LGAIGGLLFIAYLPFAAPDFAPTPSTPLNISTSSPLPGATLGQPYKQNLVVAGGAQPYTWSVTEDAKKEMPDGLQLTDAGLLSGTPTKAADTRFTVQVTDGAGTVIQKKLALPVANTPSNVTSQPAARKPNKQVAGAGPKPVVNAPSPPTDTPAKPPAEPPAQPGNEKAPPKLEDVFSLKLNLIGIFVAMVFGLTPGLLFDRLAQQADKYKSDLKNSQSTGGTQKP